ncbi:restriction endonuclease subunit S [Escherichia coli]|jgi:type I restriction enzyme S subunit|uniref:restriction endonuclease subunit S n=1 Tax=Escherichia coli TaxID=562 RepID=UPI000DD6BCF2|nr:restriction endonuclease subunit S [Escherichia coli]EEZ6054509.1 restriction endonuclease subunit S [Escherichia coli]EEZ6092508.1 restriction endonuclease subunit S [Escherichia coli]EFI6222551.1 restriction endonuclease subunit S [Escherichia coli]EJT5120503.1 restriction endonuclease subunit S [Escherichia coli]ELE8698166.1 restriction endonuclease subunit S [Escherichia coli]
MVPKGWRFCKLADISRVTSGGTPNRAISEYWQNGTIPWIRTTEVQNCILQPEDAKEYISELGLRKSSAKLIPENTILLAMIGQGKTRGQIALLKFEAAINQNCAAIIFGKSQEPEFYYHYLLSQYENIRNLSNSAGQSNLSGALVKAINVLVPPYNEQKKIAQILSTWDKAISVTEKLLTNSQQQKKALMQQLLSGKKRLLDENGVRFSGEWRNSTLSMFCNIAKGKALSASDLEVGDFPVIAGGKSSPYSHSDYTHENVVTVSASGAYAGYISYHNYKIWASDCSVVSAKADNLIDYFYQLLLSLQDKIYSLQSGGAQPHIYPKDLNSIPLWVPCVKEQQKIAAVLSAADAEISTLEKKLACLRDEKKALMQQLLTGKRRVKVDEAVAE